MERQGKPLIFDSHGSTALFAESLKKNVFYTKLFGFFVGEVMKKSHGKANPAMVNEFLKKKLKGA